MICETGMTRKQKVIDLSGDIPKLKHYLTNGCVIAVSPGPAHRDQPQDLHGSLYCVGGDEFLQFEGKFVEFMNCTPDLLKLNAGETLLASLPEQPQYCQHMDQTFALIQRQLNITPELTRSSARKLAHQVSAHKRYRVIAYKHLCLSDIKAAVQSLVGCVNFDEKEYPSYNCHSVVNQIIFKACGINHSEALDKLDGSKKQDLQLRRVGHLMLTGLKRGSSNGVSSPLSSDISTAGNRRNTTIFMV